MSLLHRLRRFLRDDAGSIAVESIVIFPILAWAYVSFFVFFDSYRNQSIAMKAAYTISDVLSRQTGYITPEYLDGIYNLHETLTRSAVPTRMRITVYTYDADDDAYLVRWSQQKGSAGVLTNATIENVAHVLPMMPDGERMVLVQTWTDFSPALDIGMTDSTFDNFVVIRPRYAPLLCWNPQNDGDYSTAVC